MTGETVCSVGVDRDAHTLAAVEAAANVVPAPAGLVEREAVSEALVLSTCHRVECYLVAPTPDAGRSAAEAIDLPAAATVRDHEESLRHLLRVAAGLESMVLGEDQVLGQVRSAYETARAADAVGPVLTDAATKAIHVGERARTETAINEGVVSLGSAAVRLAERHVAIDDATVLVLGAGEMGSLAATAFAESADAVVVANRTRERAADVAASLDTTARGVALSRLPAELPEARIVVGATASPEPVLGPDAARGAGETLAIDLGRPADLSPAVAEIEGVSVLTYGDLEAVTEQTHDRRREAARRVESMVEAEFDRLLEGFKRKRADEVIAAMYESADELKRRELTEAVDRLEAAGELPEEQREVVTALADSLVSQLLAAPTRSLRDAAAEDDWSTISTALALFDPDFADRDPAGLLDAAGPADVPDGAPVPPAVAAALSAELPSDVDPAADADADAVVVPEEYPGDVGAVGDADD